MARPFTAAILVLFCAVLPSTAQQRGAGPGAKAPCEPAAASPGTRQPLDLIEIARCYDDRWAFADAQRLVAAAIVAIESRSAAAADEIVPSGAVFVGGDVVTPALTNKVVGDYPAAAANRGIAGLVVVGVTLKTDGAVRTAEVVESIPELDKAAVDTVRKMRFARTQVAGKPVEVSFFVPARFGLAAEATPADWMALAKSYLAHDHPAAAVQTLSLALELERKDLARFGNSWTTAGGRQGGYARGGVTEPQRIHNEGPKYPPQALGARIQGMVIVEALIDLEGRVGRARVLKAVPGLDAAALDAVQQWTYTRTLVDGKPVSVVLVVTVNFSLK